MKTKSCVTFLLLGSFLASCLSAAAQTSILPATLTFTGGGYASMSTTTNFTPPYGSPFTSAQDVNVTSQPPQTNSVTLGAMTTQAVTAGDALIVTLWYQRVDGQIATTYPGNPKIQPNEANLVASFDQGTVNSLTVPMRGRNQWRQINIPFIAAATGFATFNIEFGNTKQEILVGGVQIKDYGQKSVLSTANPTDDTSAFVLSNNNYAWGTLTTNVPVTGAFFTTADKVKVNVAAGDAANHAQECNLNANLTKPVAAGDTLVAILWLRRDPASNQTNMGISAYNLTLQSLSTTIPASYVPLIVDGNWKQYYIPFTASQSYTELTPATTAQFQIMFGAAAQTLDVGGIQIIDLGTSVTAASLTSNQTEYPGRSLSDPWRATAQASIQQNRMGNLNVTVLDYTGRAVPGVTVTGSMTKHQFGFGSWANWGYLVGNPGGGQSIIPNYVAAFNQYTGTLPSTSSVFNRVNEGDYKWRNWEPSPTGIYGLSQWFLTHGITDVRGHNLVWPNYQPYHAPYTDVPDDVPGLGATALSARVLSHIDAEAGDTQSGQQACGLLSAWDVVNEPWTSRDMQVVIAGLASKNNVTPAISASVFTPWFNEVVKSDPSPYRFINDNGVEQTYNRVFPQALPNVPEEFDYEVLTNMVGLGAPIDGYTFESHFSGATSFPTPPVTEKQIFDRFSSIPTGQGTNVPFIGEVTEYDPQFSDQSVQQDYMADYMTLAFSEPNFDSFILYGFWGGDFPTSSGSTVPGTTNHYGNVFNSDWSISPSGAAYLGLTHGKWWTQNVSAVTSSAPATLNGYLGRYALTATYAYTTRVYYVDLPSKAGAKVNLQIDGSQNTSHVWVYDVANAPAIYPPLILIANSGAVNGVMVSSTSTSGPAFVPPGQTQGPQQLRINTEAYGPVKIWLRYLSPNGITPFYGGIDAPATALISTNSTATWKWGQWNGITTLAAGSAHVLNFNYHQTGAALDQVLITDDPNFVPTY